jgi:hypothetical protein
MSSVKMAFKEGYRDFKLEIDGAEVSAVTAASLVVRHNAAPELTVDVEVWNNVEIDAEGVVIKLGSLRIVMDDVHLVSALGLMLAEFKERGLDPKLLEELQA